MNDTAQKALYKQIIIRIRKTEALQAKIKLYCSFVVTLISCSVLVAAGMWLFRDISQSGLLDMMLLLFSDAGTVAVYWRDFASSVLEFLPAASLAACLGSVAMLMVSVSYLSKYFGQVSRLASLSVS